HGHPACEVLYPHRNWPVDGDAAFDGVRGAEVHAAEGVAHGLAQPGADDAQPAGHGGREPGEPVGLLLPAHPARTGAGPSVMAVVAMAMGAPLPTAVFLSGRRLVVVVDPCVAEPRRSHFGELPVETALLLLQ